MIEFPCVESLQTRQDTTTPILRSCLKVIFIKLHILWPLFIFNNLKTVWSGNPALCINASMAAPKRSWHEWKPCGVKVINVILEVKVMQCMKVMHDCFTAFVKAWELHTHLPLQVNHRGAFVQLDWFLIVTSLTGRWNLHSWIGLEINFFCWEQTEESFLSVIRKNSLSSDRDCFGCVCVKTEHPELGKKALEQLFGSIYLCVARRGLEKSDKVKH